MERKTLKKKILGIFLHVMSLYMYDKWHCSSVWCRC